MAKMKSIAERFWPKVDIRGPDECWPWLAAAAQGYGRFGIRRGHVAQATHVSWFLIIGRWPEPTLFLCHHCDNRLCVNPAHLFEGTQADNLRDAIRKGRMRRGEARNDTKLTDAIVRAILQSPEGPTALGRRYGVSHTTIISVISGRTWSHVKLLHERTELP